MIYNKIRAGRQRNPGLPPEEAPAEAGSRPPRPRKPPTEYLNFRLDILSSEAMKAADAVYRRQCGLDVRHLRILRLIGHQPGITFSQLAAETRLERGLTSRIVTSLVAKGLVRREASAVDARQFHLHLTARGEAARRDAGTLADRLEELLLTPLAEDERATLFACLDKLTAWVRQGGGLETLATPRKRRTANP